MAQRMVRSNPVDVAAVALEHPFGHEIVGMVYEMFKAQAKVQPNPRLVAIAVQISKKLKRDTVPYFKDMADDEIQEWIDQNTAL